MSIVHDLKKSIAKAELELQQLRLALQIVSKIEHDKLDYSESPEWDEPSMPPAPSEPTPAPLPAAVPVQTREVAPPYHGPKCGACGSKMYQAGRTMPSGMYVSMWKCNDSACGNEIFT